MITLELGSKTLARLSLRIKVAVVHAELPETLFCVVLPTDTLSPFGACAFIGYDLMLPLIPDEPTHRAVRMSPVEKLDAEGHFCSWWDTYQIGRTFSGVRSTPYLLLLRKDVPGRPRG